MSASQPLGFLAFFSDSQIRASHFSSCFAGYLLVDLTENQMSASQPLGFLAFGHFMSF